MTLKRLSLAKAWKAIQVELHGKYSSNRVLDLANYTGHTSWARTLGIVFATPLPCLVVTLLIDVMPLSHPYTGIEANGLFVVREYYAYLVMTSLALHQFRTGVSVLPYSTGRVVRDNFAVAALTVGTIYELTIAIGFPLPFTMLTVTGAWTSFTLAAMAVQWAKIIRKTPRAGSMLFGMFKLWLCDILLVFIYPPYFYIFKMLSSKAQMAFTALLPVIKLFMRNLFARAVGHLGDETPQLVVFNADVFGSLFISYCMQSSPSVWTTLEIMIADIVLMTLALRDIESFRAGLGELERQVDAEHVWKSHHGAVGYVTLRDRMSTTLGRASILLEKEQDPKASQVDHILELQRVSPTVIQDPRPAEIKEARSLSMLAKDAKKFVSRALYSIFAVKELTNRNRIRPIVNVQTKPEKTRIASQRVRSPFKDYTNRVRRLLYMAEFLLLINYVEVIIPLVFSVYLVATYYLPNRDYYAVYDGVGQDQLFQTLDNVLFYCLLQLMSLLILMFILKRMLGHSPIQQLAFVLERQVDFVQASLVFWLFLTSNHPCSTLAATTPYGSHGFRIQKN